jgi:hypothetical protein
LRKLLRAKQKYGNLQCTINIFTRKQLTTPENLANFCFHKKPAGRNAQSKKALIGKAAKKQLATS